MLSRLSGIANTVLQELSGDAADGDAETPPAGPVPEPGQDSGGEEAPEDVLERLAQTERLLVQLKDLVREKDAQLQQKEVALQEEKQAAEGKLMKLKIQAKAKLTSLNKRIEELTKQEAALPGEQNGQDAREGQGEEVEALKQRLQEQEETLGKLREQLAATTDSLTEMQAEKAAQLSSLQEIIQEKDARLEEQARWHQAELHQLVARSDLEAEMQQNLRTLQRRLEEQEVALLG
uniref:Uncharacterized protein n=1 Tax=Sphenodon punctatus TaxID=8508 RepID=A0A8D0GN49_SPHPU